MAAASTGKRDVFVARQRAAEINAAALLGSLAAGLGESALELGGTLKDAAADVALATLAPDHLHDTLLLEITHAAAKVVLVSAAKHRGRSDGAHAGARLAQARADIAAANAVRHLGPEAKRAAHPVAHQFQIFIVGRRHRDSFLAVLVHFQFFFKKSFFLYNYFFSSVYLFFRA
jgi:hypothetical protein